MYFKGKKIVSDCRKKRNWFSGSWNERWWWEACISVSYCNCMCI